MNLKSIMTTNDSWGLLGLRVVTGTIFIAHGLPKWGIGSDSGLEGLAGWLGRRQKPRCQHGLMSKS